MVYSRKEIYILVLILSMILYGSGVLSGLFASNTIKKQTKSDIVGIEKSMDEFRSNLENIQIQQNFFNIVSTDCRYSKLAMDYMKNELSYFWQLLPYRIEEYENQLLYEEDYMKLKKEYSFLALKAWIIATQNYNNCQHGLIPLLYFYSRDCDSCVEQGQNIDRLKELSKEREVIAFAIDLDLNESSIELIKNYFKIENAPAIVINNTVMQGRVFDSYELEEVIS